ncbi:hypothetical protein C8D88_110141 [Lentzea atacamensis]|uniref:Uncharacterized protein n=1 Tax=Lentzea atacamensis TaxID=531938 RepID=A0A316HSK9_9PSEU|nr:hypothetical protein [Lentzea atacamensis]PWK83685.1 hypothetical protein C8D88_110141 [Lentzea atacamensis]RAS70354.1 hypothetical protein C8D87_101654 [Lentzea atacamensis]
MAATPAVAASSGWRDDEDIRMPSGDVHAWWPGQNQTLCGVPLSRARLDRFPHVLWIDALWINDTAGAPVMAMCRRCAAAARPRTQRRADRLRGR